MASSKGVSTTLALTLTLTLAHLGQLEGGLHDGARRAGRDAAHEERGREGGAWDRIGECGDATLGRVRAPRVRVRGRGRGRVSAFQHARVRRP